MKCQYITSVGQCRRKADIGNYCIDHSPKGKATVVGQYHLAGLLAESTDRHSRNNLKDISTEIAVLKASLERRVSRCNNDAELDAAAHTIKDYALAIDKLTSSLHAMDLKIGNVLNKKSLMVLAQKIIQVIDTRLKLHSDLDTDTVDLLMERVGEEIVTAVAEQGNE